MRSNPLLQKTELLNTAWPYWSSQHPLDMGIVHKLYTPCQMGNGEGILISETNVAFLAGEIAELGAPTQPPPVVFPCRGKEQAQPVVLRVTPKSTSMPARRTECFRSFLENSYPSPSVFSRSTRSWSS